MGECEIDSERGLPEVSSVGLGFQSSAIHLYGPILLELLSLASASRCQKDALKKRSNS